MRDKKNTMFSTDVMNLGALKKYKFTIPTYQRPYVWEDEQIKKLISDFYRSFQINNNHPYYIGTILTKDNEGNLDLIDGQQRFTTLWLLAFVFKKLEIETQLTEFLEEDSVLRLGFEIRKEVEHYLNQLLGKSDKNKTIAISNPEIEELPYLQNIAKALTTIENIISPLDRKNMPDFGNYIYNNVCMVRNNTPENIDLNKLFSTINSAGIQLEQTDIVKSNLLRMLGDEKVLFGKIWEACENMNNFFERNARAVFSQSNWKNIDLSNYNSFNKDVFKYKSGDIEDSLNAKNDFSIDVILENNDLLYSKSNENNIQEEDRESEEIYCRSIINFGQLLLHTYRIHLKKENLSDFKGTFHVNRLIEIFRQMESRNNSDEIKRFFCLLWDVRFIFDKFIIKWISNSDNKAEHLELTRINTIDGAYIRDIYSKSNMLMLQSVLYFTGDYLRQFWLTPFFNILLDNISLSPNDKIITFLLEKIDNQMSTCDNMNDKEVSFLLLGTDIDIQFDIIGYLNENKGTSFQHYWFQKLEYILWKNWENREDPKFKNFRITSKNSIEHIHPQSKADKTLMNVDDFGNLVLLSVAQNSEYSNKEVNVKKQEFINKNTYDSLKSYFIFQDNDDWTPKEVDPHRKAMLKNIADHYNN